MPGRGKEYSKSHNILDKFESMSRRFNSSHKSFLQDEHNSTKPESEASCLPSEEERLRARVAELEHDLQTREELIGEYEKKLLENSRHISTLEGKLAVFEEG